MIDTHRPKQNKTKQKKNDKSDPQMNNRNNDSYIIFKFIKH